MARFHRPLSRKLIRLGFQALGRSRAHRQDVWPGLQIDKAGGRAFWRGRPLLFLQPFGQLLPRNAPLIAIVGSGPSLRDQRVEALGDDTAILCNGAASLTGRIRPLAVAVEDERFVFRHHAMLAALPPRIALFLSPAAIRAWAECSAGTLENRPVALIDNLEKPVGQRRRPLSDPALDEIVLRGHGSALSTDPDQGVVISGTVAFSALQIAMAARPARILLAGVDLSNDHQPRFYEDGDRAASALSAGLNRILAGFRIARDVAIGRGIDISCASPVSELLTLDYPRDQMLDPGDPEPAL